MLQRRRFCAQKRRTWALALTLSAGLMLGRIEAAVAAPAASYGPAVAALTGVATTYPMLFATPLGVIIRVPDGGLACVGIDGRGTSLASRVTGVAVRPSRASALVLGAQVLHEGRLKFPLVDAACGRSDAPTGMFVDEIAPALMPTVQPMHVEAGGALRWLSQSGVVRANPGGDRVAQLLAPSSAFVAALPSPAANSVVRLLSWSIAPDETAFVVAQEMLDLGARGFEPRGHYVFSVAPDGAVTRRTGDLLEAVQIRWVDQLDGVLVSPASRELTRGPWRVVSRAAVADDPLGSIHRLLLDPAESEHHVPGASETLSAVLPSSTGLAALTANRFGTYVVRPFSVVVDRLDLDGDGLDHRAEAMLGTNPASRDTDRDGFDDRQEASLGFNPTAASSAPPTLPYDPRAMLAPSFGVNVEEHRFAVRVSDDSGRWDRQHAWIGRGTSGLSQWLCYSGLGTAAQPQCLHADGRVREEFSSGSILTLDGEHRYEIERMMGDNSRAPRVVRDLATGATRPLPMWEHALQQLIPISEREAFGSTQLVNVSGGVEVSRIVRFIDDRVEVILDSTTACGLVPPRTCGVSIVGWDPAARRLIASVWSSVLRDYDHTELYALSDRASFLADVSQAAANRRIHRVYPLQSGGYVLERGLEGGPPEVPVRVDPYFRSPSPHPRLGITTSIGLASFRRGIFGLEETHYELQPHDVIEGSGGSNCFNGWCVPSGASRRMVQPLPFSAPFAREWVTASDAVAPGDTIGWTMDAGTFRVPQGPSLVRITREGAIVRWMDQARLEGLIAPEHRSTPFMQRPNNVVRSIGVSPDRTRVCLAMGAHTWELQGASTSPSALRLADPSAGEACAYREDGALATVGGTPRALRVGSTTIALPAESVDELRRVDQRWLLAVRQRPSLCVADDATIVQGPTVALLAPAFGGVAWIDGEGNGWIAPSAQRFCQSDPSDRFVERESAWRRFGRLSGVQYEIIVSSGPMAVRPDGLVLFGFRTSQREATAPPQLLPDLLLKWFPEYRSIRGETNPAIEPLRRTYANQSDGFNSLGLAGFTALTYVPGPTASDSWGYAARLGTPYSPTPLADSGVVADAGSPPPQAPPRAGCGCRSAPTHARSPIAWIALATLTLAAARQRARRDTAAA